MHVEGYLMVGGTQDYLLVMLHTVLRVVQLAVGEAARVAGLHIVYAMVLTPLEGLLHLCLVVGYVAAGLVVHDDLHPLVLRVGDDPLHIEVGCGMEEVEHLGAAPLLPSAVPALEKHCVDIVLGGEVDIPQRIGGGGPMAVVGSPAVDAQVHAPPDANILQGARPGVVGGVVYLVPVPVAVEYEAAVDEVHGLAPERQRPPSRFWETLEGGDGAAARVVGSQPGVEGQAVEAVAYQGHLRHVVQGGLVDGAVYAARG